MPGATERSPTADARNGRRGDGRSAQEQPAVGYVLLGRTEFPAVFDWLGTVGVGAVFTLSPPLSMIAFSATLFSAGPGLVALAVSLLAGTVSTPG